MTSRRCPGTNVLPSRDICAHRTVSGFSANLMQTTPRRSSACCSHVFVPACIRCLCYAMPCRAMPSLSMLRQAIVKCNVFDLVNSPVIALHLHGTLLYCICTYERCEREGARVCVPHSIRVLPAKSSKAWLTVLTFLVAYPWQQVVQACCGPGGQRRAVQPRLHVRARPVNQSFMNGSIAPPFSTWCQQSWFEMCFAGCTTRLASRTSQFDRHLILMVWVSGCGVALDYSAAVELYQLAAAQDDPDAQYVLFSHV